MRIARAICETIHLGALGLWAGAVLMTGVTAALVFPTMKGLDPSLPGFEAYTGDHWAVAAGSVMNRAFLAADWIGLVCGLVATATLVIVIVGVRVRGVRPATVLRWVVLGAAIVVSVYTLAVLRPAMQRELVAHWDTARAGENAAAARHMARFNAMHPRASFILMAQLVLVASALGAGGYVALTEREVVV